MLWSYITFSDFLPKIVIWKSGSYRLIDKFFFKSMAIQLIIRCTTGHNFLAVAYSKKHFKTIQQPQIYIAKAQILSFFLIREQ